MGAGLTRPIFRSGPPHLDGREAGFGPVSLRRRHGARPTYELLADEFECLARGAIEVKGKGEIEAWYLIGSRGDREPTAAGLPSDRRSR